MLAHGVDQEIFQSADDHLQEVLETTRDQLQALGDEEPHHDEKDHVEPGVGDLVKVVAVGQTESLMKEFVNGMRDEVQDENTVIHTNVLLRRCRCSMRNS